MWIKEKSGGTIAEPKFTFCCNKGKVSFNLPPPPPNELLSLLINQDATARNFRQKIRLYNSAFAFSSIAAKVYNHIKYYSLV